MFNLKNPLQVLLWTTFVTIIAGMLGVAAWLTPHCTLAGHLALTAGLLCGYALALCMGIAIIEE